MITKEPDIQKYIENQAAELAQYRVQVEELLRHIEEQNTLIEQQKNRLDQLLRRVYGASSERHHPDQLLLQGILDKLPEDVKQEPENATVGNVQRKRRAKPTGRIEIPAHLAVEEIVLDVPEAEKIDPVTGEALVHIRDEITERLAYKPACLYALHYIRPVYGARSKSSDLGIVTAELPDSIIDKCKADESLIAHLIITKYTDHQPLYRQAKILARQDVHIARSTMCSWVVEPLLSLELLYNTLKQSVLSQTVLYTDDTPVKILNPGHGKTKTGRMWVYVSGIGPPYRVYDFTPDRKKERPNNFLADYEGYIHADAYPGYDELFAKDNVHEVACWAHTRRKFDEAKATSPETCSKILGLIGVLYKIEREIKNAEPKMTATQIAETRQAKSAPLLDSIFNELKALDKYYLPKSPLGKAVGYALNQEQALRTYIQDGRLNIDNNTAENAIRPLALGRKNWLFAGSARGGKACAIALSLLQSAKACGLNQHDYLTDILRRYQSHKVLELEELLPANWKPKSSTL